MWTLTMVLGCSPWESLELLIIETDHSLVVSKLFSGVLSHWTCRTEMMHAPRLEVGLDLQVSYCQKQFNGIWVVILLVICATAIPVNIYVTWHPERGNILSLYSVMVMGTGSFMRMGSNLSSTT